MANRSKSNSPETMVEETSIEMVVGVDIEAETEVIEEDIEEIEEIVIMDLEDTMTEDPEEISEIDPRAASTVARKVILPKIALNVISNLILARKPR